MYTSVETIDHLSKVENLYGESQFVVEDDDGECHQVNNIKGDEG